MEQQSTERQDKWAELEREFKINETLTRELCELILAKDPGEMRLGTEYSWGKLNTREIIQRSKNVFASYNESRTELLRDIQRQSEERRLMIESLRTQVEQSSNTIKELESLHQNGDQEGEKGKEQIDQETGEVMSVQTEVGEKAMQRMPYTAQQAFERGDIGVYKYQDEENIRQEGIPDGRPEITDIDIKRGENRKNAVTRMKIWEEPKDVTLVDVEQQAEMAERAITASIQRSGASMSQTAKKTDMVASRKAATEKQFVSIDVTEIAQRLNNRHWTILNVIGSTGMCEGSDIIDTAIENISKDGDEKVTANGLRYILMNLVDYGCLTMDTTVSHPLKVRFATYCLSDIGRSIYISKFGKDPVMSERNILIAEHDNLEHAFGIKELKRILEQSGSYTDVSMERASNTIRLKDGTLYIPDIIAQGKFRGKTYRAYMEYERGTHHQADFNIKLNKAVKVTRYVDIVCPNGDVALNLKDKVIGWVESRGGHKNLQQVKVRITTLRRLNGVSNINNDDNWLYVFNLRNGSEPIERR